MAKLWEEWKARAEAAEAENVTLRAQVDRLLDEKRAALAKLDTIVTTVRREVAAELGEPT